MTEQTNKYVYKVEQDKYTPYTEFNDLKDHIDELIDKKWNDALDQSGYIADCILKGRRFYTLKVETEVIESAGSDLEYTSLVVGEEDTTSTFFIPNGPGKFIEKTMEGICRCTYSEDSTRISSSKVVDGNFAVIMNFNDETPKILLAPLKITDVNDNYWQYYFARPETPVPAESLPIWWDTDKNVVRQYDATNLWNDSTIQLFSIPLGIVHIEDGAISNIVEDFNVSGYNDQTIWVNPGITVGIANGRAEDSTIDVITATTGFADGDNLYPEYISVDITEKPVEQVNFYSEADTILSVTLNRTCRDVRTLTISINGAPEDNEENVLDETDYTLDNDMLTIRLTNPLSGVSSLHIRYYDQPSNIPVFVSNTGELLPPTKTDGYSYSDNLGYYIDKKGRRQSVFRLGVYSLGYIAKKSLWTDEPLSIIEYYSKQRSLLTDTEDVRYLIELYNQELTEAIGIALQKAGFAAEDVQKLRAEILAALLATRKQLDSAMDVELITSGGMGNENGALHKHYDNIEIIPMGVKVIPRTPTTGFLADLNLRDIELGKVLRDGKYSIEAIQYSFSIDTFRKDLTSYEIGTVFNIEDYTDYSFKITEERTAFIDDGDFVGCAIEADERIHNSGLIESTDVRIGKNYIKSPDVHVDNLFLSGQRIVPAILDGPGAGVSGIMYDDYVGQEIVEISTDTPTEPEIVVERKAVRTVAPMPAAANALALTNLCVPISYNVDVIPVADAATNVQGTVVEIVDGKVATANSNCVGVISSPKFVYDEADASSITIPTSHALVAFSGNTTVKVLGPVYSGDKLYHWGASLRDSMTDTMKSIFMSGLGISEVTLNELITLKGYVISSSLLNIIKAAGTNLTDEWLDENLHKCIGIATEAPPAPVYVAPGNLVKAVVNFNFESNKSVNDIKRELGLL